MIAALVGHRGTGKSELINRVKTWLAETDATFFDLDEEIEKKIGRTIGDLFLERGEEHFRELERQLFLEIIQKEHVSAYICLGAGFDLSIIPEHVEVLWIRRETDGDGRIFIDRPRLNPIISPLAEYLRRADIREAVFRAKATRVYTMPEGIFEFKNKAKLIEKEILSGSSSTIGGVQTILPSHLTSDLAWNSFKNRFVGKSIIFELRDDFLNEKQIQQVVVELPNEKFIYAIRRNFNSDNLPKCDLYDWPLENSDTEGFLVNVPLEKRMFSLHEKKLGESIDAAIARLTSYKEQAIYLKLSLVTDSFQDLMKIYHWQQQDRLFHNVLPRSSDGRWSWFRLYMKPRQFLNFWCEADGSALDQPTLFYWLATPKKFDHFAAVLGDPIGHSFSAIEHLDYFSKLNVPFFAIKISRDEWLKAFPILEKLGLHWAAVTAPLKESAAEVATTTLDAVNTLCFADGQWFGASTDGEGFLELIDGVGALAPLQSQIVIWGGGGILDVLRDALPRAIYFSSRTGQPRAGQVLRETPKVLVMAAPRGPGTLLPPESWKPSMVIDLNYKEDSLGREYAQLCNTNYQSGLKMFLIQAQGQKAFWNRVNTKFGDK